jgi:hypothetical protein
LRSVAFLTSDTSSVIVSKVFSIVELFDFGMTSDLEARICSYSATLVSSLDDGFFNFWLASNS